MQNYLQKKREREPQDTQDDVRTIYERSVVR
jgi:hypothetical protein